MCAPTSLQLVCAHLWETLNRLLQARKAHPLLSSAEADALGASRVDGWVPQEEWLPVLRTRYPLPVASAIATELYPFTSGAGAPDSSPGAPLSAARTEAERAAPNGSVQFVDLLQATLFHALRERLALVKPLASALREEDQSRSGFADEEQFQRVRCGQRRAAVEFHRWPLSLRALQIASAGLSGQCFLKLEMMLPHPSICPFCPHM